MVCSIGVCVCCCSFDTVGLLVSGLLRLRLVLCVCFVFDCFRFGLCCGFVGLGVCFSGLVWGWLDGCGLLVLPLGWLIGCVCDFAFFGGVDLVVALD